MKTNDAAGEIGKHPICCSQRLILAIIGFFMFLHIYAQRVSLSMVIVCMVNHTAVKELTLNQSGKQYNKKVCAVNVTKPDYWQTSESFDGPFVWGKDIQGHIQSSFFYGYFVSHIPGGVLAEQFGGKYVLTVSLALSTFTNFITPLSAQVHVGLLIFTQILSGSATGTFYPAMHAMWGRWSPPLERSFLCGLTYSGVMLGNVAALAISGFLCKHGFSQGWDSIFYILGMSSLICIIVWTLTVHSTPDQHPRISEKEKNYIKFTLMTNKNSPTKTNCFEIPWKQILISKPVWAVTVAHITYDWGFYTFLTNMPTYYDEILFLDIVHNGILSALPFLGLWLVIITTSIVADKLQSSGIFSTLTTRKIFTTIGLMVPALLAIALGFLDCRNPILAVILIILLMSFGGFVNSGFMVNSIDIAPRFAGTLMGLTNGIASCTGFLGTIVASYVTKDKTMESWQIVFSIVAVNFTVGSIIYLLLASAEVQPWATENIDSDKMILHDNDRKEKIEFDKTFFIKDIGYINNDKEHYLKMEESRIPFSVEHRYIQVDIKKFKKRFKES